MEMKAIAYNLLSQQTLDEAYINYTTTEKELITVVFAFEQLRAYLVGTKVRVYTDHTALEYVLTKKDAKLRLICWILLLQKFEKQIKDNKGTENFVVDHLDRFTIAGSYR